MLCAKVERKSSKRVLRANRTDTLLHAMDCYEADVFGVRIEEADEEATMEMLLRRACDDEDISDLEPLKERIKASKVEVCGDEIPMLLYLTWWRKRPEKVRKAEDVFDSEGYFDDDEIDADIDVIIGSNSYDIDEYLGWNADRSEFLKSIEAMLEEEEV